MPATYLLRKHLRSLEISASPEAAAERQLDNEANKRACEELELKFPRNTRPKYEDRVAFDNFYQKRDDFYYERLDFWKKELRRT